MSSLLDDIWIETPMIPYVVMLTLLTGTNVMLGDASSELPSRDPVVKLHHRRQAPKSCGQPSQQRHEDLRRGRRY